MSKPTITVPPSACQAIEDEIQAKGLTAPRVTKADIDALMARIVYTYDVRPNGSTSTLAHAFLDGEFLLASGHSACVSVENFDAELGMKIATENARKAAENKLWELEGYALRKSMKEREQYLAVPRCGNVQKDDSRTDDCPHAAPFRYCPECVADPCPVGLGNAGDGVSGK